jgi:hypothetical protein
MTALLPKEFNTKRSTKVFAPNCALSAPDEDVSIRLDTVSLLQQAERQAESYPDNLKSTDFTLLYLYQISHIPVKKNLWMTEMPGYCDFIVQAPHSP